jgi:hypothetical protein
MRIEKKKRTWSSFLKDSQSTQSSMDLCVPAEVYIQVRKEKVDAKKKGLVGFV